jgi:hypothetical protein
MNSESKAVYDERREALKQAIIKGKAIGENNTCKEPCKELDLIIK